LLAAQAEQKDKRTSVFVTFIIAMQHDAGDLHHLVQQSPT
jgi:hypothetical protein